MKRVKFCDLMDQMSTNYFILAETAFSHEGNVEYLKNQIDVAVEGQADGIKFQLLFDVMDSYTPNTEIFKNFHKWSINEDSWIEVIKYAKSKDLEVVVLPIDLKSLNFVKNYKDYIDAIEIHSICFNQVNFLKKLKKIDLNLILGVGGRTPEDIDFLFQELNLNHQKMQKTVVLMYGFQSFPTNFEKINLSKLKSLKQRYSNIIGYADHTSFKETEIGRAIIKYSYLYGARVFEKHLVLEKGVKRIDYESAVGYNDLINLRNDLDELIKIIGVDDLSNLNEVELKYRNREKQLLALENLKAGDRLTNKNLGYKVSPDKSDFEQREYSKLLGKGVSRALEENQVIKRKDISS
jgi:N,N'-diacetyllegionaminate synthase